MDVYGVVSDISGVNWMGNSHVVLKVINLEEWDWQWIKSGGRWGIKGGNLWCRSRNPEVEETDRQFSVKLLNLTSWDVYEFGIRAGSLKVC